MSIILRKHHGELEMTKIAKLSTIGLLVALATSFVTTIWAVYLDSFLNSVALVGLISALLTLVGIISYFFFIPLVERTSKSKIFYYTLFLFGITYILFAINKNFYIFVILAFFMTLIYALRITSFGIIIKDFSKNSKLSKNEGLRFTFINFAWIIGPLIAGFVSNQYGINMIFVISAVFIFLALILGKFMDLKDHHTQKKIDRNLIKNFFAFFKDKNRIITYILGGGVSFWWVLIYLYTPLFIIRNNLSNLWVGYFLFAIPIPLILFEYKFANIAGRKGFRKLFKLGYLIPAIAALICFFTPNVYSVLGILIFASVGLAMLEPTTEAYFFDVSKKRDQQRFYGPYNTRIELAGLIGKFIPSLLVIFLPFKSIFLFFSAVMFMLFLVSFKAKKIVERRK